MAMRSFVSGGSGGGFTSVEQLDEVPGLTGKVPEEAKSRLRI